jgi:glycerol-3-phosphate acyltransferase PlsX
MDPRKVNGGVFLGLNGIVIKSHGGTDAVGMARAIDMGHAMVRDALLVKIRDTLALALTDTSDQGTPSPSPALEATRTEQP